MVGSPVGFKFLLFFNTPPLITPQPLIMPISRLLSGWLSRCLSSCCPLPSTCASASHRNAASHRAPLTPLVWLVVTSLLVTPPPPVRLRLCLSLRPSHASCLSGCHVTSCHATTASRCLRLCLSLCRCLSSRPSCTSFLAGCCITSCHTAAFCSPALCLSSHRRLSPRPSPASSLAVCCLASCHATASHQPVPLPLSTLPPLIALLLQSCVKCRAGNNQ